MIVPPCFKPSAISSGGELCLGLRGRRRAKNRSCGCFSDRRVPASRHAKTLLNGMPHLRSGEVNSAQGGHYAKKIAARAGNRSWRAHATPRPCGFRAEGLRLCAHRQYVPVMPVSFRTGGAPHFLCRSTARSCFLARKRYLRTLPSEIPMCNAICALLSPTQNFSCTIRHSRFGGGRCCGAYRPCALSEWSAFRRRPVCGAALPRTEFSPAGSSTCAHICAPRCARWRRYTSFSQLLQARYCASAPRSFPIRRPPPSLVFLVLL